MSKLLAKFCRSLEPVLLEDAVNLGLDAVESIEGEVFLKGLESVTTGPSRRSP